LSNIARLLTILTLTVFTGAFRLASLQLNVQDDLWQTGSNYASALSCQHKQARCEARDNDADDQDIDLVFVNEEPKLHLAKDFTKKQSKIFSNMSFKIINSRLINPYWETLFEKLESPGDTPFLIALPLRSPPSFPA
jgi:hypothetical protein